MKEFRVPDMTCGHCKAAIEKALVALDPSADVEVDLASHRVRVHSTESAEAMIRAMKAAGYEATPSGA